MQKFQRSLCGFSRNEFNNFLFLIKLQRHLSKISTKKSSNCLQKSEILLVKKQLERWCLDEEIFNCLKCSGFEIDYVFAQRLSMLHTKTNFRLQAPRQEFRRRHFDFTCDKFTMKIVPFSYIFCLHLNFNRCVWVEIQQKVKKLKLCVKAKRAGDGKERQKATKINRL